MTEILRILMEQLTVRNSKKKRIGYTLIHNKKRKEITALLEQTRRDFIDSRNKLKEL